MIWSMIWSCGHRSRPPMLPHRNAGRLHLSKAESIELCDFRDGSSHYRCWSAILVTTAMTQHPPSSFPIFPPTSALPLFNEGLGVSRWENCGIKDVCRYVLEHFGGLMRLIIFPWNKKVNSPPYILSFFVARGFSWRILRRRVAFGVWTPLVAVDQKSNPAYPGFYNGGGSILLLGSRGRAPVGVLDEFPQKLKQNVKLLYTF